MAAARELTKIHEEIWRGTLAEAVGRWSSTEPRGEFTLVIAPPEKTGAEEEATEKALKVVTALEEEGVPLSQAVRAVARALDVTRRKLYQAAQEVGRQPREE